MRWRAWLAVAFASALAACAPPGVEAPDAKAVGPLLPALDAHLASIASIEIHGAGDHVLVTLERGRNGWTVRERDGWPAAPSEVRALLADIDAAQRVEAKTAKPERHARIGVEAVSAPDARGVEVRLRGAGWSEAIVVGDAPPTGGGRFVRLAAQPQAWRVDRSLLVLRDPVEWLDTALYAVPLPRVVAVRSHDDAGHAFELTHRDDRFRIADAPSAAMGDSYRGDMLAGLLDGLRLEDVAADDGRAAERTVDYALDDGRHVVLESWRVDGRIWMRARECAGAGCVPEPRWPGRRFLLPANVAANLWLTRDQILGHAP